MRIPKRQTLVLAVTGLAAAGVGVATAVHASADARCLVDYQVTWQWPGGFSAGVTIATPGARLEDWSLTWSYADGQRVTSAWGATMTQSGRQVRAVGGQPGGRIAAGRVSFGFFGSAPRENPTPTSFNLNGTGCVAAPVQTLTGR